MSVVFQEYPIEIAEIGEQPSCKLEDLLNEIKVRAQKNEFDEQAYISDDIIEKFKEIGVYRALVPKRFGGDEVTPIEFCELIEKISIADGSAGWVASFGMSPAYLAGLPLDSLKELYRESPDVVFAGGIFPPHPAEQTERGYLINGRWKFSSGCMGASVFGVGFSPRQDDNSLGLPHMAVLRKDQVMIEETWDTIGLKGTGSHDLLVKDAEVYREWTLVRGAPAKLEEPFFRYPALSFATQVLSVVGLGVARAAINQLIAMSEGTTSITGNAEIGKRPLTQYNLAKLEAELSSARSWFYSSMAEVWETIMRGDQVEPQQVNFLRLSSTHATRVCAEVSRQVQILSGIVGIYRGHPLCRYVNDTNVITQHAFMSDLTYQNAGTMLFGNKPLPGYL